MKKLLAHGLLHYIIYLYLILDIDVGPARKEVGGVNVPTAEVKIVARRYFSSGNRTQSV